MTTTRRPAAKRLAATAGTLPALISPKPFQLEPGHPLTASRCLVCRLALGVQLATAVGVGVLAGDPCGCGRITSDVFLIHAIHLPLSHDQLADAIARGLNCPADHP